MDEFSEDPTFWTFILKPMIGIFVMSEGDAVLNVVLCKAEITRSL